MTRTIVNGVAPPSVTARLLKGIVLTIACGLVILPFVGVFSTSISSSEAVTKAGGFLLLPSGINFDAYASILSGGVVSRALVISVLVTAVGTILSLFVTTLIGYALSRPGTFAHKPILLTVLFSLLFTPGLIPVYLMVKEVGLLDSYAALIVPSMVSAFNIIVVRAFFGGIPAELIESAKIDGASEWQIFTRISLPLSKAVLAVVGLFYAVGYWNSFFNALLYLNDSAKWPLQMILRSYVLQNNQLASADLGAVSEALPPQESLQMAILVISVVPILLVYPFLQKHFAKGVLTGAVKG